MRGGRPQQARWALALAATLVVSAAPALVGARPGVIPQFPASARCPNVATVGDLGDDVCRDLLDKVRGGPLGAKQGERVYREAWQGPYRLWFGRGDIVLRVAPDGRASLAPSWSKRTYRLTRAEAATFERKLAGSDFAVLPPANSACGQGIAVDGVETSLEAIVDGRYRLVYFDFCGVGSDSLADALDDLFNLAVAKSGRKYPFGAHPTYRG